MGRHLKKKQFTSHEECRVGSRDLMSTEELGHMANSAVPKSWECGQAGSMWHGGSAIAWQLSTQLWWKALTEVAPTTSLWGWFPPVGLKPQSLHHPLFNWTDPLHRCKTMMGVRRYSLVKQRQKQGLTPWSGKEQSSDVPCNTPN